MLISQGLFYDLRCGEVFHIKKDDTHTHMYNKSMHEHFGIGNVTTATKLVRILSPIFDLYK